MACLNIAHLSLNVIAVQGVPGMGKERLTEAVHLLGTPPNHTYIYHLSIQST